ncbi:MAG TPA: YbaB/EbfC family nucleoid-associated protein [Patescibacteria group bacterium]|nr:YbaB/EbfC family nucleoid-associated protein [Patescibacteria group bacterium]
MFDSLKKMGDLKKMRDQALALQNALQKEVIEIVKGPIKLQMTGDQRVHRVEVDGVERSDLKDAINEAVKKTQEVAAKKMGEITGGLSGLLG